jgi:hypothetical protein
VTLILTHLTRDSVVQVTDRLVSTQLPGEAARSYDPESNKNVIFLTGRGIISIGYSGLSYLNGIPTDEWIVETLIGEKLQRPMMVDDTQRQLPSISHAVRLLADGLATESVKPGWKKAPIHLAIGGWLGSRGKRPRPVGFHVSQSNGADFTIECAPRRLFGVELLSDTPRGYMSLEERRDLLDRLKRIKDLSAVEAELIQMIRVVAARNPQRVGADCMGITLPHPQLRRVIVNFVPNQTKTAVSPILRGGAVEIPVAYTPFIVSPGVIWAPNVMSSTSLITRGVGGWDFVFPGATLPNDGPIVMTTRDQPRKPPPGAPSILQKRHGMTLERLGD